MAKMPTTLPTKVNRKYDSGAASITPGAGADDVPLAWPTSAASVSVNTGSEVDELTIGGPIVATEGDITITTDGGDDTLNINQTLTAAGDVNITTGSGVDQVASTAAITGKAILVNTGSGSDTADLDGALTATAGSITLKTEDGDDQLSVGGALSATGGGVSIGTEAGNDAVTLDGSIDVDLTGSLTLSRLDYNGAAAGFGRLDWGEAFDLDADGT